jgi:hypothetical protein
VRDSLDPVAQHFQSLLDGKNSADATSVVSESAAIPQFVVLKSTIDAKEIIMSYTTLLNVPFFAAVINSELSENPLQGLCDVGDFIVPFQLCPRTDLSIDGVLAVPITVEGNARVLRKLVEFIEGFEQQPAEGELCCCCR